IEAEAIQPAEGRGNLIARIRGDGSKRPFLIVAHVDVVGIEEGKWTVDPFEAVEKDGFIWGRGAVDDKGMAACAIEVLRLLARDKVKLKRDVILALTCDEESGGQYGVKWLIENRREQIDAEFGLNEGGKIIQRDGRPLYLGVQNAEKRPHNLRLVARGISGHGSVPRPDNPILALARALNRIGMNPAPVMLNETTRRFFSGMAEVEDEPYGSFLKALSSGADPALAAHAAAAISERDYTFASMMRNSISPTILKGGIRTNVIPSEVEVNLNCRLLPGEKVEDFARWLTGVIQEPAVEVVYEIPEEPEAPSSPIDSELFRAIEAVAEEMAPGAPVVPYMSTGGTDSARLRRAGIPTYGLVPMPLTLDDLSRMHGNDERLQTDSVRFGIEFLYHLVLKVAG
ncbi:MAG: M20/M25/M40 family metallo-hydrolase, partial [Planctomycetota bacterium]|nr:M20/M25/M40 family metallo-hydrolase [Planctomycetota bacterium]